MPASLKIVDIGEADYEPVWRAMQTYTDSRRRDDGYDQLWFVEHPAVFTLGQAASTEHVLAAGDIPLVKTDRGGQVTYHGPGQLVGYVLFNLNRLGLGVRSLVDLLEETLVEVLAQQGIAAQARADAPGVYVADAKVAALGLRIRHGCSFHGFSLNVAVNKEHFSRINPCGFENMAVCNVADLLHESGNTVSAAALSERLKCALASSLARRLGYTETPVIESLTLDQL